MSPYTTNSVLRRSLTLAVFAALLLLAAAVLLAQPARAGLTAGQGFSGGPITSDTTLTQAASPYTITTPITVTSQATLTIEAGTVLRFNPNTWLLVEGGLNAQGTHAQQILLAPATALHWQGLIVAQPSNDVQLQSVTVSGATTGLAIHPQSLGLARASTRLTVVGSLFSGNTTGIAADYSVMTSTPRLTLRDNLISANGTGVQLLNIPTGTVTLKLDHNSFAGNTIGLVVSGKGRLKAHQQWWNSPNGPSSCNAPSSAAGDRICVTGQATVDFFPWSKVPAGRAIIVPQGGAIEGAIGQGSLSDSEGAPTSIVTLTVPMGAFSQPVDMLVSAHAPSDFPPLQHGLQPTLLSFEMSAVAGGQELHQIAGGQPLQLTVNYSAADLAGADPSKLAPYYYDETLGIWSFQGVSWSSNPTSQQLVAQLGHLSRWNITDVNLNTLALPLIVH